MEEKLSYPAWLHLEGTEGVGVTFPDFPGCVTQGDTVEEALRLAPEALSFHLEGMLEDGSGLPEASSPDEVAKSRDGELLTMVVVPDPRARERINISVMAGELAKIDRAAESLGMSRSGFMVAAAIERAKKRKP
jgi:predicted RNase H-like HicB family nuclease